MAAPTLIASYSTDYTSAGTSKSVSVTCNEGDTLILYMLAQKNVAFPPLPVATGITFYLTSSARDTTKGTTASWVVQRAPASNNLTITLSESGGVLLWGMTCVVIRNCSAVLSTGTASSSGAPVTVPTTAYNNSAILSFSVDGNAVDGSARVWKTINSITPTNANGLELTYVSVSSVYTVYAACYNDVGIRGSKTVGLSAPTGQSYLLTALELIGEDSAVYSSFTQGSYSTTTSRNATISTYNARQLLIGMACVGVQPANGTDSGVTTTMSYGGVAMTSIAKVHANNDVQGYLELFYLLNPPAGKLTATLTASTTVDCKFDLALFNDVDQATPFTVQSAFGSSTQASLTFTNNLDRSAIITAMVSGNTVSSTGPNGSPTGNTANSLITNGNTNSYGGCSASQIIVHPSATQTTAFTLTSSPWAIIGLCINPGSYFPPGTVYGLVA